MLTNLHGCFGRGAWGEPFAPVPTLTEFLAARLADDKADARRWFDDVAGDAPRDPTVGFTEAERRVLTLTQRVLAEVDAKQRILRPHFPRSNNDRICNEDEDLMPCEHLRILASVYAAHEDYRREWA